MNKGNHINILEAENGNKTQPISNHLASNSRLDA
jgi:hypothetical protein